LTNRGRSQQGEGQGLRGLEPPLRGETSWRQTRIFPPSLVQARLDVGWHAGDRIGVSSIEVFVPGTRELLALEVHPNRPYPSIQDLISHTSEWCGVVLRDVLDPDPF
jgi:hypothetical protein